MFLAEFHRLRRLAVEGITLVCSGVEKQIIAFIK